MDQATTQPAGTSTPLTEAAAASVFEGLLSTQEETEHRETPPAKKAGSEVRAQAEPDAEEAEESEQIESDGEESEEAVEEGAEASEESETDASESDDQTEQPELHTVKVNGVEEKVTLDELKKGYSRNKDYTQKTQAVSAKEKSLDATTAEMREQRDTYAKLIPELRKAMTALAPQEPNWEQVERDNPDQYLLLRDKWQRYQQQMAAVKAEEQRVAQDQDTERTRNFEQTVARENEKLLEVLPTWKNEQTAKAERKKLIEYAEANGYTRDEAQAATDHRIILILRKAMLYDSAQAKKDAIRPKVEEKIKAAKPGPASTARKSAATKVTQALRRLDKSGSIEDGASVFHELLE